MEPLSDIVTLLQPAAPFSKIVNGAGRWRVRRSEVGRLFYCVVLNGSCCLAVEGDEPTILQEGDFTLIPSAHDFTVSSLQLATPLDAVLYSPVALPNGEFRVGNQSGPPDVRLLIGYCIFGSHDAPLLVSLLPQLVHIRGERRLSTLVQLVREESREQRPGRDVILPRLLEILLIEALRSSSSTSTSSGLVRGLSDERLGASMRRMHQAPAKSWTVAQLATEAALSRSAFFERFSRVVGLAPMEYLLSWRMALAKNLLQKKEGSIAQVAEHVGYSSASTFSVAFTRFVGVSPARYARGQKD